MSSQSLFKPYGICYVNTGMEPNCHHLYSKKNTQQVFSLLHPDGEIREQILCQAMGTEPQQAVEVRLVFDERMPSEWISQHLLQRFEWHMKGKEQNGRWGEQGCCLWNWLWGRQAKWIGSTPPLSCCPVRILPRIVTGMKEGGPRRNSADATEAAAVPRQRPRGRAAVGHRCLSYGLAAHHVSKKMFTP